MRFIAHITFPSKIFRRASFCHFYFIFITHFFVESWELTVYIQILKDVNFVDNLNLGFLRFYFCGSFVIIPSASSVLRLFYKFSRI